MDPIHVAFIQGLGDSFYAWKLQDELLTFICSLEAFGVNGDQYRVFMTPVSLSRLPHDIRLEWSREGSGHEKDLVWLLTFLQREIERRERSDTFKDIYTGKVSEGSVDSEKRKSQSSASVLQTSSEVNMYRPKCMFCDKSHKSENCYDILKLPIAEREEVIHSAKVCFRCLVKGHFSKGRKSKCIKCKGSHNVLCCKTGVQTNKGQGRNNLTVEMNKSESSNNCVTHVVVAHCRSKFKEKS